MNHPDRTPIPPEKLDCSGGHTGTDLRSTMQFGLERTGNGLLGIGHHSQWVYDGSINVMSIVQKNNAKINREFQE
jgi:hypothetical protein